MIAALIAALIRAWDAFWAAWAAAKDKAAFERRRLELLAKTKAIVRDRENWRA